MQVQNDPFKKSVNGKMINMTRPKWFHIFASVSLFVIALSIFRDFFLVVIGDYFYNVILAVMVGTLAVRISYLILKIRQISKSIPQDVKRQMEEERKHQNQLIIEQLSGFGDDLREFFHMLRQKSFWKIFKDNLRMN